LGLSVQLEPNHFIVTKVDDNRDLRSADIRS